MKVKNLLVAIILLGMTNITFAEEVSLFEKYKSKLRPFMSKLAGEAFTSTIFGPPKKTYKLPPIPQINASATSTKVYDENEIGTPIKDKAVKEKFDYKYVVEVYDAVRGEEAGRNDIGKWLNVLNQGGSREGVYRAIVLDETYGGMENMDNPINDGSIKFTIRFMERFFDRTIKKKSIEGVNLYRLKREMTKRALDMVDSFAASNPEHLYQWYSVFSAEMAREFKGVWKNRARLVDDAAFHYKWAKGVPFQHLKSELIIKIHKIYNSIN
ncbi:MAG: hypothetical protein KAG61_13070 [Bacteriovoracaceae bacterium]|nr:hypothetical protein [Bacteriovoracaceae bacterium]